MKSSKIKKYLHGFVATLTLSVIFTLSASALEYKDNSKIRVGLEFGPTSPAVTEFYSKDGFRVVSYNEETHESTPLFETAEDKLTIRNLGNIGGIYNSKGKELYRSSTQEMYIVGINGEMEYEGKTYLETMKLFFKDGLMRVINIVSFETYLKGVLPREIYPSWPTEALKTAAVAARTFAFYSLGGKHAKYGVDICTTTCCQVYGGNGKNEYASTNAAVEATENQVLAYNGKLAMTVYTATAGMHTESSSGAWGGNQSLHPYLCGVETPFETPDQYTNGCWSGTYTASEIFTYIDSKSDYKGKLRSGIASIEAVTGETGYVRELTVTDTLGNSVTARNSGNVRGMLSKFVRSACFTITPNYYEENSTVAVLTANGVVNSQSIPFEQGVLRAGSEEPVILKANSAPYSYTITGLGWGHGVGLSQNGAMTLAKMGKTYDEILYTYYPGTYITTLSELSSPKKAVTATVETAEQSLSSSDAVQLASDAVQLASDAVQLASDAVQLASEEVAPNSDTSTAEQVAPDSDATTAEQVTPNSDTSTAEQVAPDSDTSTAEQVAPNSDASTAEEVTPDSDTSTAEEVAPDSDTSTAEQVAPDSLQ